VQKGPSLTAGALLSVLLVTAGCGGDSGQKTDGQPEATLRALPSNMCDWIPREYLTGLLVNEPTNSSALGVPTSICTAVAKKGARESRYVNVILKRFESVALAREDNAKACRTFAALAPTKLAAPSIDGGGVDAVATCARRGDTSTYLITVPNESGDTLLVSIGGRPPATALSAAIAITDNVTRQLG
jgi:hypothetical protein